MILFGTDISAKVQRLAAFDKKKRIVFTYFQYGNIHAFFKVVEHGCYITVKGRSNLRIFKCFIPFCITIFNYSNHTVSRFNQRTAYQHISRAVCQRSVSGRNEIRYIVRKVKVKCIGTVWLNGHLFGHSYF